MATVNKKDLIAAVADTTGLPAARVRLVIQATLGQMIDTLATGNRLELRDFGVFEPKRTRPRLAQNPRTGVGVTIPAHGAVRFKMGRMMRDRLAALGDTPPARGDDRSADADPTQRAPVVVLPRARPAAEATPRRHALIPSPNGQNHEHTIKGASKLDKDAH
ncbi:MAG: hypothetical protein C0475_08435 [Planctomyces sp.]|nr:hypothetical protein [Planctomyces sp.]MBA4120845.1 hypothetical protein [Isosphaera sp.]